MTDDRFISPSPPPEGLDRELIEVVAEELAELGKECNEAIQRAMKMLRFGVDEVEPGQVLTNADRLAYELGDVVEVADPLIQRGVLSTDAIELGRQQKREKLRKFLQQQP